MGLSAGPCGDWLLWQLADSAFPTGGFAHSGGVEAARQSGEIASREDLVEFLRTALFQLGHSSLPFVKAAAGGSRDFAEIDWFCDVFTSSHVANRASRAQGQALLAAAERSFANGALKTLRQRVTNEKLPGHLAPVFGAVGQALQLNAPTVMRLFVFTQMRGWVSSAVRLGIVGPFEGQSIQHRLGPCAERALERCAALSLDEVAQTAPLIELFQGAQDRLYSRLFQS